MIRQWINNKLLCDKAFGFLCGFLIYLIVKGCPAAYASVIMDDNESVWGFGLSFRYADIPFTVSDDLSVNVIPEIYYNGEYFFMEGLSGGIKILRENAWSLDFIGAMRFGDLPKEEGRETRLDTPFWGIRARYDIRPDHYLYTSAMADFAGSAYLDIGHKWRKVYGRFKLEPYVNMRWKNADYNRDFYDALSQSKAGMNHSLEPSIGLDARYHLSKGVYLTAGLQYLHLDHEARKSRTVDGNHKTVANVGLVLLGDGIPVSGNAFFPRRSYLRAAYGWATPSNMGDILAGKNDSKEFDDTLSSVFYGYPLKEKAFEWPLDFYLHSGLVWHHSSDTQDAGFESVVAIKAYYTLNWPVNWRFGVAQGLSYVSRSTYVEKSELDRKDRKESKLMNYLDVSFDVNIGGLMNNHTFDRFWVGYSLHHRSAIFEKSSHFGRIKGGSNYNSIYVQTDF
ncbi:hypothetical protein CI610_00162 [invertebrate metagenome]|uniref:MltA-interacting protein n=1 Tax=invertebrate metagenome TaxID=1711999 RepID=A0A2H9TCA8_9ZZZZ